MIKIFKKKNKGSIFPFNKDATETMKSIDSAFFSFENSSDFYYFLNAVENKIKAYREMRGKG